MQDLKRGWEDIHTQDSSNSLGIFNFAREKPDACCEEMTYSKMSANRLLRKMSGLSKNEARRIFRTSMPTA